MKTINELKEELLSCKEEIRKIDEEITTAREEHYKIIREKNFEYYKQHEKEIDEYNNMEKELNDKLNRLYIKQDLIQFNFKKVFDIEYKEKIESILNEYVNKRVGDKTREKIQNRLNEEIPQGKFYISQEKQSVYISFWQCFEIDLTINYYAEYQNDIGKKWFNDGKEGKIIIYQDSMHNNNDYIEDYEVEIDYLIDTKEKLKAKIEEVNSIIESSKRYYESYISKGYNYKKIYECDYIYR